MHRKIIPLIIFSLLLVFSCTEDTGSVKFPTNWSLLIHKNWYPVSSTVTPAFPISVDSASNNFLLALGDCYLDSYYYFNADSTAYFSGCWFDKEYDKWNFTWSLSKNDSTLIEYYDSSTAIIQIVELTTQSWRTTYEFSFNNIDYFVEEKFEAK